MVPVAVTCHMLSERGPGDLGFGRVERGLGKPAEGQPVPAAPPGWLCGALEVGKYTHASAEGSSEGTAARTEGREGVAVEGHHHDDRDERNHNSTETDDRNIPPGVRTGELLRRVGRHSVPPLTCSLSPLDLDALDLGQVVTSGTRRGLGSPGTAVRLCPRMKRRSQGASCE